ncbi:fructose-bisphosphate aldolase 6, cytosolic [Olea europaea subsp. europaea]|uniref:Fructose-bisphosphate aldolase 6, cytosolic n=1 Tax=Olea europaea subsp. europaea TaxID=158383 RepID=A0A8S0UI89_OLEEU|nr:fructose-bisphosphate aldolase 6, cytosolic [Olea europaea subsp. europaea]
MDPDLFDWTCSPAEHPQVFGLEKKEKVPKAQAMFLARCKPSPEATPGTYQGSNALSEASSDSLHVMDYIIGYV